MTISKATVTVSEYREKYYWTHQAYYKTQEVQSVQRGLFGWFYGICIGNIWHVTGGRELLEIKSNSEMWRMI